MINILKKFKFLFIILGLLLIFIICITTIKIDYVAYIPGNVDNVNDVIEIDTPDKSNNYYSTSVSYLNSITPFQKFVFDYLEDSKTYKKSKTITNKEDSLRGIIEHNSAIYQSIIAAYNEAGVDLDYKYLGTYVYYSKTDKLNIGDVILGNSYEECVNNLNNGVVEILRSNEKMSVTLTSDDLKLINLEYGYYEINNDKIKVYASNNEGPSAGFMQALKLYDDLVEENLARDYKIAGTGTIDEDGNVGAIGCVDIKLFTAMYNNCDIFFVPKENKEEAEEARKKMSTNMVIFYVDNINDAIMYLRALE